MSRNDEFGRRDDPKRIVWELIEHGDETRTVGATVTEVQRQAEERGVDPEWTRSEIERRIECGDLEDLKADYVSPVSRRSRRAYGEGGDDGSVQLGLDAWRE
ncbi:MAG: hypothetical protein ABEI27_13775 [Halobellus sp.]|uniref:hypothetical protein n=1 Tax=Halobellus sp. TaxID=1979212 RepID=UPI0035D4E59C